MKIQSKKIAAGSYRAELNGRYVDVTKVYYPGDGEYWIAAAGWDRLHTTDPVQTKREAMQAAKEMLLEA